MTVVKLQGNSVRYDAVNHVLPAPPDHARNRNRRKQIDHRVVDCVGEDRVLERVHVASINFRKAVVSAAFTVEELQHHHAAHVLLQVSIDAGNRGTNAAVRIAHLVTEDLRRDDNAGKHGERDQRQLPVHAEHDGKNAGQRKEIVKDRDHARREHLIECVDIGGDTRDEPPHGILVVKSDVHALQMAEDLATKVEHDLLPGPLHEVGLEEFEYEREYQ